jgi:hypothetical protein
LIVDVKVYILKRRVPRCLLRFFFLEALIHSSAPYYPRIGEKERSQAVQVACPECSTTVTL